MSDLSKAEGGDDLDLDVLQEVADDSRDRMALALGGLTKTAQCPPVT